jgi:hypothetical protein
MSTTNEARTTAILMLAHEFGYHRPPNEGVAQRHERVRAACREAAEKLLDLVPATTEAEKAFEALREAMFWANAAIACYPFYNTIAADAEEADGAKDAERP